MSFNIVDKLLGITLLGTEWVLWLLIILSIVSFAIVIERIVFYRKLAIDLPAFMKDLTGKLSSADYAGVKTLCESQPAIESQVVLRGLEARTKGTQAMDQAMSSYLIAHKQHLDRGFMILGTLGNNAPFIGLFGTVLGIIIAFHSLASNPAGGPSVVMSGISEALIATAVGLMVAIPAVIFYNAFQRLAKKHMNQAEAVAKFVLSFEKGA